VLHLEAVSERLPLDRHSVAPKIPLPRSRISFSLSLFSLLFSFPQKRNAPFAKPFGSRERAYARLVLSPSSEEKENWHRSPGDIFAQSGQAEEGDHCAESAFGFSANSPSAIPVLRRLPFKFHAPLRRLCR